MARLPSVAVALLLLVLAGCNGLAGPADERRTVNPDLDSTPSPTARPVPDAEYPSGVSAEGFDPRALTDAHVAALENRSNAVRVHTTVLAANGTTLLSRAATTRENGSALSVSLVTSGASPDFRGKTTDYRYWSDGDATFERREGPNGTHVTEELLGGAGPRIGFTTTGRSVVKPILLAAEFEHVGTERRGNATAHLLTATPDSYEYSRVGETWNVRLAVAVAPTGVVEWMLVRYDARVRGVEVTFVRRFRVFDVGTTTVERPGWVEDARRDGDADGRESG